MNKKFKIMREKETERILKQLKGYTHREKEIYLEAYADALEYAFDFIQTRDRKNQGGLVEITQYLP